MPELAYELAFTSIFAAIFAIILILLSSNLMQVRAATKIFLGDGGNETLRRALCAQSNFVQFVPIFLILSGLNEVAGMNDSLLAFLSFIMLYGRVSHAYGLLTYEVKNAGKPNALVCRNVGLIATFAAITLSAFLLLMTVTGV